VTSPHRLQADFLLLLAAVVWGSAFAAQRVAAERLGVFLFNGPRFLLGALVLLPLLRGRRLDRRTLAWAALAGVLLSIAAALQQAGLKHTTAGNAGFITGLYVVLVPMILFGFWREKLDPACWVAAGLAAAGLFLLSVGGEFRLAPGDGLELVGALFWALHVITIGRAMRRVDPLVFSAGQFLVAGLLNTPLGLGLEWSKLGGFQSAWWAVAYTGVFSIGLGFTLQAVAQKRSPPADAAILLSMESIFAALFGWVLLGEQLTARQLVGCGLILAAMLLAQLRGTRDTGHGQPVNGGKPPGTPRALRPPWSAVARHRFSSVAWGSRAVGHAALSNETFYPPEGFGVLGRRRARSAPYASSGGSPCRAT